MNRQTAVKCLVAALLTAAALTATGCGGAPKITVGSMNSTEQTLLAEIVAQHLEHRLDRKVDRRTNLGQTVNAFQALQSGEVNLYPEYSGSVVTQILKEQPSTDASQLFQRVRGEMKRTAQADFLDPLGIDSPFVAVIRANDPRAGKVSTMSEAAAVSEGWALGVTAEFQQLSDGMPVLTQYKLPMKAAPRSMDAGALFKSLEQGDVTMLVTRATDGNLTQATWKALRDDRNLFVPKQAALLVLDKLLVAVPSARPALQELSGKFTLEKMRKLNAQVDLDHMQPKDVAAAFLMESGLR